MRPIAFAALIAASLAVSSLATPGLAQTMAASHPSLRVETADMTVRDGSDAGPIQPVAAGQADDAGNATDLPASPSMRRRPWAGRCPLPK